MSDHQTTRRSLLKRALALGAGVAGLGAAGGAGAAMRPIHLGTGKQTTERLRLTARFVQLRSESAARYAVLENSHGAPVGHLYVASTPFASPFDHAAPVSAVEAHTLALADGTLSAHGALRGLEGSFHVIGGTGRYAGASGSYTYVAGHGRAEIDLTIVDQQEATRGN